MHSKKFTVVKTYYNTFMNGERIWDETKVKNAVVKGWITAEEYKEITGKDYEQREVIL